MDKVKISLVVGLVLIGMGLYSAGVAVARQNGEITQLHQEADTQTKTIHSLQLTVEQQQKQIKTLQQDVNAANQKAENAEQKVETSVNP